MLKGMETTSNGSQVVPEFLDVAETAIVLKKAQGQVRAMIADGSLPAVKIGGPRSTRIPRTAIDALIAEAMQKTAHGDAHQA